MRFLVELVINGVSIGALYALLAVGFVVVYRATHVVNFAQGAFLLIGGITVAELAPAVGFWWALLVGIGTTVAAAVVLQAMLAWRSETTGHLQLAIVTIGFDVALTTEATRRIGTSVKSLDDPFGSANLDVFGILVPQARITALLVAAAALLLLTWAFRRTRWGTSMRAAAEDREAAALVGIQQRTIWISAWAIAAVLATVAVVFLTAYPTPGLSAGTAGIALKILPAVILGGLDSPGGAVLGGLLVGVVEQITLGYSSELAFLGHGLADVTPYIVALLVLVIRPSGLFGTREVARV